LELLHAADLLLHRLIVGERTAEPALSDEECAGALCLSAHDTRELWLRANEQHILAAQDDVTRELLRDFDLPHGLLQIDDMDAVPLSENEAAHLGIPTTGLMPEVDAGREEGLEGRRVGRRLLVCHWWYEP